MDPLAQPPPQQQQDDDLYEEEEAKESIPDSIVYDLKYQYRVQHSMGGGTGHRPNSHGSTNTTTISTISTIEQQCTEYECDPFFVPLEELPISQLEHLRSVGLLMKMNSSTGSAPKTKEQQEQEDGGVEDTMLDSNNNNNNDDDVLIELDTSVVTTEPIDVDQIFKKYQMEHQQHQDPTTTTTTMKMDHDGNNHNNNNNNHNLFDVCLLRDKHYEYLHQVWKLSPSSSILPSQPSLQPTLLRSSFISLDSSRPWMLYWCLHGCDLLHHQQKSAISTAATTTTEQQQTNQTTMDDDNNNNDIDSLLTIEEKRYIFNTIQSCFTMVPTSPGVTISMELIQRDTYLQSLLLHNNNNNNDNNDETTKEKTYGTFPAGGFGGNIQQLPHAATAYAAINTLMILMSSSAAAASNTNNNSEEQKENDNDDDLIITANQVLVKEIYDYLLSIKPLLYPWFISLLLPQNNGSFRMHHDGEMDVRATYCILSVVSLLGYFTVVVPDTTSTTTPNNNNNNKNTNSSLLLEESIVQYIALCQTYEGGFGGEPYAEAHGGYTYCAVAAIHLWLYHQPYVQQQQQQQQQDQAAVDVDNGGWFTVQKIVDIFGLMGWLCRRQLAYEGGFNGRSNKLVDGCYSYWLGGAHVIVRMWLKYIMNEEASTCTSTNTSSSLPTTTHLLWDPWMKKYEKKKMEQEKQEFITKNNNNNNQSLGEDYNDAVAGTETIPYVLFDYGMLQRYILLCAQDVHGGLRDKPSKSRDFYHTCYNLSGLSISQHYSEPTQSPSKNEMKQKGTDDETYQQQSNSNGNHNINNNNNSGCNIRFGHPQFSCVGQTHPCYNLRMDRVHYARTKFDTSYK